MTQQYRTPIPWHQCSCIEHGFASLAPLHCPTCMWPNLEVSIRIDQPTLTQMPLNGSHPPALGDPGSSSVPSAAAPCAAPLCAAPCAAAPVPTCRGPVRPTSSWRCSASSKSASSSRAGVQHAQHAQHETHAQHAQHTVHKAPHTHWVLGVLRQYLGCFQGRKPCAWFCKSELNLR